MLLDDEARGWFTPEQSPQGQYLINLLGFSEREGREDNVLLEGDLEESTDSDALPPPDVEPEEDTTTSDEEELLICTGESPIGLHDVVYLIGDCRSSDKPKNGIFDDGNLSAGLAVE